MTKYEKEKRFMQKVGKEIIEKVKRSLPSNITHKNTMREVVSSMDTDMDKYITHKLKKSFPKDRIISEELNPESFGKDDTRTWVIDPICGSGNAIRRIPLFVTNVLLIENKKVQAAWVMDHAQKRIIWCIGGQKVYENDEKIKKRGRRKGTISYVELDWGHRDELPQKTIERYAEAVKELMMNNHIEQRHIGSSLSLAYVATGQLDAALAIRCYPWDILAACFLAEQNGGKVTNFDGTPWTIETKSAIIAGDKEVHKLLLDVIKENRLDKVK